MKEQKNRNIPIYSLTVNWFDINFLFIGFVKSIIPLKNYP